MELSDTSLPAKINEEIQAGLARELLRLELDHWRETGTLIHPHILSLIHQRHEALLQPAKDEAELLFRSALAMGYGITEWVERAWAAGVPVNAICLEELECGNFRTRASAVLALETLGNLQENDEQIVSSIIKMLVDKYPQVRVSAIHALEQLQPEGEWREHLVYECYVPAGEFVMGDDGTDLLDKNVPAHNVVIEAFYISKYPVTNADYKRYLDDIDEVVEHEFELPEGKPDYPVVDITWHQARSYTIWAGMRLPTEAEWEKAASWSPVVARGSENQADKRRRLKNQRDKGRWSRFVEWLVKWREIDKGGEGQIQKIIDSRKQVYPWGNVFDPTLCNTRETGFSNITPVGTNSPEGDSPYGCADMVGNIWEWTSSHYKNYPYQADDGREDISLPGDRVVRGGSFFSHQGIARAAGRFGLGPYSCNLNRGYRMGMSANPNSTLK